MTAKQPERTKPRLGVLGAGQLSLMLIQAANKMGYEVDIIADQAKDPAAPVAANVIVGSVTDVTTLHNFLAKVDCVAIEKELTDPDVFRQIPERELNKIRPSLQAVALCSDKLQQKHKLQEIGVLTSPWIEFDSNTTKADTWLARLEKRFPTGFVIKWARGGFDGRGTCIIKEHTPASRDRGRSFIDKALKNGTELYGEELIPFEREVAVIAVRKATGESLVYPTVVTTQWEGICSEVRGPAVRFGDLLVTNATAEHMAQQIGEGFDLVGTYAVEFFVTRDGRVLVNEVAPRVHNSGHFSLDGAKTSQFENHWRALLDLPLGSTSTHTYFGMVNILGPEDYEGAIASPDEIASDHIMVHWYGKLVSRGRRKMGHINITASSMPELEQKIQSVQTALKQWGRKYKEKTNDK